LTAAGPVRSNPTLGRSRGDDRPTDCRGRVIAMEELIRGARHFHRWVYRHGREFFEDLAEGQAPHYLFITCSDSRIQPSMMTETGPGDMFHLRNIGNIVPLPGLAPTEDAVLEYAVEVLGVRWVIVCGHSQCGAMKALMDPEPLHDKPYVYAWLQHAEETRLRVHRKFPDLEGAALLREATRENVRVQVERIRTRPDIAPRLVDGRLLGVVGWVYEIESGDIVMLDAGTDEFVSLIAADPGPGPIVA
jgi:carbonic anhydrase